MDETAPAATDHRSSGGRRPRWVTTLVLPVTVAVVAAVAVAALTPLGDGLRELLFPTHAAVSGSVLVGGQPAAGARLTVDGNPAGNADPAGKFLLQDVGDGPHRLRLETIGAQPRDTDFRVERGATEKDLAAVDLTPLAQLGYYIARLGPPRFPRSSGPSSSLEAVLDYDLTVWIRATPDVLGRLRSVTYGLPAPLPSQPVIGSSAQAGFCYRQAGELAFQDLLGSAQLATATAVLDLGDEHPFQISARPDDQPPPTCPVTRVPRQDVPPQAPQPPPPGPPVPVPLPVPPDPTGTGTSTPLVPEVSCSPGGGENAVEVRAQSGGSVRWRNSAAEPMELDIQGVDSPTTPVDPGETREVTFDTSGSYAFTCVFATTKHSGTVQVE